MSEILLSLLMAVAGFSVAVYASQRSVRHAIMLAYGLRVPAFLIGITIMSIGTDIPEIANSIVASIAGHGDLNIGDSVGSVTTQITLVLGLLPFITGPIEMGKSRFVLAGGLTVAALVIGIGLFADGFISRIDAMVFFTSWIIATAIMVKYSPPRSAPELPTGKSRNLYHGLNVLGYLVLVGIGAGAGVKGILGIAEAANIPEYLISFFGASIGTSLPELFVDVTAIRSGRKDIAIGDIIGSCMVDATLSISAGPLIAPTLITAALAIKGSAIAIVAVLVATVLLAIRKKHDKWTGTLLLILYLCAYFVFFR